MERRMNQAKDKKILIIEDQEIFIEMFGDKLKWAGFDVLAAKNGAWGLKEALTKDFDLLIIDIVMPAMGGEEIVAKLKINDKTKNIPIIILSASVDEETQNRVERMGVSVFFVKTRITPSELLIKVKELLNIKA